MHFDASNKQSKEKAVSGLLTCRNGLRADSHSSVLDFTYSRVVQKAKVPKHTYMKIIQVKTREGIVRTSDSLTKLDKKNNDKVFRVK